MAYSESLAQRIRDFLINEKNVVEKKMMGGLTFMVNEKMCMGIIKDELMCRIDPAFQNEAITKKGCKTMIFTKRPMSGYVMIDDSGMESDKDFAYWINLSLAYNPIAKKSKK